MIRVASLVCFLLALVAVGCGNECALLTEHACARHGEDSVVCISRGNELESASTAKEKLCKRALLLYTSLPESELSQ